jgi:hypothetical protein
VRFSNNSIFNQAGATACIDINPGNPIPAIEASLVEVRKAAAHVVARPCTTAVTDARLFRIQIGARFTHNALAVDRALAPGSF